MIPSTNPNWNTEVNQGALLFRDYYFRYGTSSQRGGDNGKHN